MTSALFLSKELLQGFSQKRVQGQFPFSKKFWEFWFLGEWLSFFGSTPLENPRKTRMFWEFARERTDYFTFFLQIKISGMFFFSKMECYGLLFLLTLWHNLSCGEKEHDCRVIPSSFMLSIMVISLFNLAIDSCSFPLDRKSLLKPGIIP